MTDSATQASPPRRARRIPLRPLLGILGLSLGLLSLDAGPAAASATFSGPTNFAVGIEPRWVEVGDFNGDGKQDLAVANRSDDNPSASSVSIRLGNGLGGFGPAANFATGTNPTSVAVGDFDGDGKQDLAVSNAGTGDVSILLGDGLGAFAGAVSYPLGNPPSTDNPQMVRVGDFNGDGKQDLAVSDRGPGNVSILLGLGGGTFSAPTTFPAGSGAFALAIGDFNRDGRPDIAVTNYTATPGTVSILIGTGTGSFTGPTNLAVDTNPDTVVVGDFNRDGKQDLAVGNNGGPLDVSILLGDGAGHFGSASNIPEGAPSALVLADFNLDGTSDLAVAHEAANQASIMAGDGTGSFTDEPRFTSGGNDIVAEAAGDFNGDGRPDLVLVNFASTSISVFLNTTVLTQSITFPQQGPYTYGQPPVTLGATASSGLPVTYTVSGGPCTVSGQTLTLTGTGSCFVLAQQPGNATYAPAPSVSQEIFILQAQTITFPQQGPYTFGQAPVTLGATASSGLPVTYTVTSGPCTVSGGTLTLTGAGSCVVAADQAGDRTSYGAAPRVSSTIVVAKATPTIGWADPAPITYGTALSAGQLDATASVPGSFAYAPGAGTILNAGANQPLTATFTPTDTGNYTTATATAHITVNPAPTATTLTATPNPSLPGQAVTFTATVSPGDGGGTFGFKADGTTIAGCGAQAVSAASPYRATCTTGALGAGAHAITATYSGDANYQANTSSALAQQVGKASTQTTLASSANPSVYGQTVTFTATVSPGDGGGTVAFSSDGTTIPTCSAQAVSSTAPFKATCTTTGLSVGTHAITAVYSGDANYQGSSSAAFSQAVNKAPTKLAAAAAKRGLLTTTFAATLTRRLDGAPLAGQPVVFLVQGVRACQATTNSAGVAVCTTVGLFLGPTTYTATYAGDANYQPSTATATL